MITISNFLKLKTPLGMAYSIILITIMEKKKSEKSLFYIFSSSRKLIS